MPVVQNALAQAESVLAFGAGQQPANMGQSQGGPIAQPLTANTIMMAVAGAAGGFGAGLLRPTMGGPVARPSPTVTAGRPPAPKPSVAPGRPFQIIRPSALVLLNQMIKAEVSMTSLMGGGRPHGGGAGGGLFK